MKKHSIVFLLFLINFSLFSQGGCLEMGMQPFGTSYYGSAYPFVNIMKNADRWHSRNVDYVVDGENAWETQLDEMVAMDENGYPLSLPQTINHPNAETPQGLFTFWAAASALPAGNYVILYDGEGQIEMNGGGINEMISETTGRIEFSFSPIDDYLELFIKSSNAGNHIRNIRVLLPGTEATYQSQPWTTSWREKIAPFKTIRFMEFGATNSSIVSSWNDRTMVDDYTYGSDDSNGVPFEWMIDLCNQTQSNAWINIPHLADENYIIELANLFKTQLDPNLKIYIEYSNETWNWLFDQTAYLFDNGDQNMEWPERTVYKMEWAMEVWTNAFGNDPDRVVRVLGSQGGWFDIGDRQYAQIEADGKAHLIDAIAIGGYLIIDPSTLNGNSTATDVLTNAQETSFGANNNFWTAVKEYATLANQKGKKLLFYEGGQHFTPEPFGSVQPYNQALMDAQTDPGILTIYNELFDSLRTLSNDNILFIHHVLVSPKNGQYGSWGALENQFTQNAPYHNSAPKYQALLDNIEDCESTTLAVSYLDPLQALMKNDAVLLSWSTAMENNNDYFVIQRSSDGVKWENIGKIKGKGHAGETQYYQIYDRKPLSGTSFYRLQQFDFDASFYYSNTVKILFEQTAFSVFPNPSNGEVELVFATPMQTGIYVYDVAGKLVLQAEAKSKNATLDLTSLEDGLYFIGGQMANGIVTERVVLQR